MRYVALFSTAVFLAGALFAADFPEPEATGPAPEESVCLDCHASDMVPEKFREIPRQWEGSWHYRNNVSCSDCHGGDPKDVQFAMSPERGFVGVPAYRDVPAFCGKCHAGIRENYGKSGHGIALRERGSGPNCVTCHGAHEVQKANIDIINSDRCTQCHSYERAETIKGAIASTEKVIGRIEHSLKDLKNRGVYTGEEEKELFRTRAEFHTLFHTVDVDFVKDRTDEFTKKLSVIETWIEQMFEELGFRKDFAVVMVVMFLALGILFLLLSRA